MTLTESGMGLGRCEDLAVDVDWHFERGVRGLIDSSGFWTTGLPWEENRSEVELKPM